MILVLCCFKLQRWLSVIIEKYCCESGQVFLFLNQINILWKKLLKFFVAGAVKYWREGVDRKMLTAVFNKTNSNWVIDLDSSKQKTSSVFWLTWKCCHLIDLVWGLFFSQVVPQIIIQTASLVLRSSPSSRRAACLLQGTCGASTVPTRTTWPRWGCGKALCWLGTQWGVCRVWVSVSSHSIWNSDFGHC